MYQCSVHSPSHPCQWCGGLIESIKEHSNKKAGRGRVSSISADASAQKMLTSCGSAAKLVSPCGPLLSSSTTCREYCIPYYNTNMWPQPPPIYFGQIGDSQCDTKHAASGAGTSRQSVSPDFLEVGGRYAKGGAALRRDVDANCPNIHWAVTQAVLQVAVSPATSVCAKRTEVNKGCYPATRASQGRMLGASSMPAKRRGYL